MLLIGQGHRTLWKLASAKFVEIEQYRFCKKSISLPFSTRKTVRNERDPLENEYNDSNSILKKSGDRTIWFSGDDLQNS